MNVYEFLLTIHAWIGQRQVHVPKKLDKSLVDQKVVKSVEDWDRLHGIILDPGSAPRLPRAEMASLVRQSLQCTVTLRNATC